MQSFLFFAGIFSLIYPLLCIIIRVGDTMIDREQALDAVHEAIINYREGYGISLEAYIRLHLMNLPSVE